MSTLTIQCSPEQKAAWVRAAQASPDGPRLADWVIATLNRAASPRPTEVFMLSMPSTGTSAAILGIALTINDAEKWVKADPDRRFFRSLQIVYPDEVGPSDAATELRKISNYLTAEERQRLSERAESIIKRKD